MKKKTFGRIAAVGLAGLTVVPAIAIVASADVTVDEANASISGTAYYFTRSVVKTTYTSTATYNSVTFAVSFNDSAATNIDYVPDTIGTSFTVPDNAVYYTAQSLANTQKNAINNAVSQENSYQKTDVLQTWKNKWLDYAYYEKNKEAIGALDTGKYLTAPSGQKLYNTSTVDRPSSDTQPYDQYTSTVNIETKTMKEVAAELAPKVYIENGTLSASGDGTQYSVNTTGSSNSGNSNSGSTYYGQYEIPAGYRYASSTSYYSSLTETWYPNLNAFRVATGYDTSYATSTKSPSPAYSSTNCYFNPVDGNYYTSAQATNYYPYSVYVTAGASSGTENAVYRVSTTGLYYYTWSSAYAAANYNSDNVVYVTSYSSVGNYFSRLTGSFYSTYASALSASGGNSSYVVTINGTASDYADYLDPYYYYFMNQNGTGSSSSSSSLGGSSVKIGNKSGWTNVRSSIRSAAAGTTLNVSLNGETYIPSEILTALDGKNVTVNFTLKNGSVISFNGRDISSPKDVNVNVAYNTKNISSSLVNKAKSVNNAVSTSQISISSNTFGGSAALTVKFNANRSGYTAKIYRYNSTRNSLQLVDTSRVASTGKVTFDGVTQGGDYVIVLC